MNSGLNPANPVPVAAFRSALVHQWAVVALIFAGAATVWSKIQKIGVPAQYGSSS